MNIEMHGKLIKSVVFALPENYSETLKASDAVLLEMSATFHGDHDEFWIIECHKIDGKFMEVKRHNLKYVDSFTWDIPTASAHPRRSETLNQEER